MSQVRRERRWCRSSLVSRLAATRAAIAICTMVVMTLPWLMDGAQRSVSAAIFLTETFAGATTTPGQFTAGGVPATNTTKSGFACLTAAPVPVPSPVPNTLRDPIPGCPGGPIDSAGSGALRLTNNTNNQAGFVLFNQAITSGSGLQVDFDMFQYASGTTGAGLCLSGSLPGGICPADGISFFLIDGSVTPTTSGGTGGSLGYAQRTPEASEGSSFANEPGLAGGYIGVAFDVFGRFSHQIEGKVGGPGQEPNSISVRGAGSGLSGYQYITGTTGTPNAIVPAPVAASFPALPGALDAPLSTTRVPALRHVRITLSTANILNVTVSNFSGGGTATVGPIDLNTIPGQTFPSSFKFGFAGSTGAGTEIHEIQNLTVQTLLPAPNLSIVKEFAPGPFTAGGTGSFTLTVSNATGVEATSQPVTVTDPIDPATAPLVGYTIVLPVTAPALWDCSASTAQQVRCTRADPLASGASYAAIPVNIAVLPTAPLTLKNIARVNTPNDIDPSDDIDDDTVAVIQNADLAIDKTADPTSVVPGGNVKYVITVTNNGPGAAVGAPVTDDFPALLTGVSWNCTASTGSSCNDGSGEGDINTTVNLLPSGIARFDVTATVPTTAPAGVIPNTATVAAAPGTVDPNPANNTDSAAVTVNAALRLLGLAKEAGTPIQTAPDTFTVPLTFVLENFGNVPITNVQVNDNLAATFRAAISFSIVPGSLSATGGLVVNPGYNGTTDINLLNGAGTLGVGASATISVQVSVKPGTTRLFLNQAVATHAQDPDGDRSQNGPNPDTDNDGNPKEPEDDQETPIRFSPLPDLQITKSDSPDPVQVGQNITYTLTIRNNGPTTATNVVVSDAVPDGATFVSASAGCSGTSTVTCTVGSLAPGASAAFTVVVRADRTGVLGNLATVGSDTPDPTAGDNRDTATTVVTPVADLAVTKTGSPNPVQINQTVTFTMTVTNNGPSTATGVTLTDTPPAGLAVQSATPSQGSCVVGTVRIICQLNTLVRGASATVTVVGQAIDYGSLVNTVAVTGFETDPNPNNNTDVASVSVSPPGPDAAPAVDLELTKSATPPTSVVGDQVTFSLTIRNLSATPATNVVVTDFLPLKSSFVSAAAGPGTCDPIPAGTPGAVVVCNLGTLNGGATATVTIVVRSLGTTTLANQAVVSATERDPNSENNGATASVTVTDPPTAVTLEAQLADLAITKIVKPLLRGTAPPLVIATGQTVVYTSTITNNGPGPATNVIFTDVVAPGLTVVSSTPSQGGPCTTTTTGISCNLGSLAVGATATVGVVARADTPGLRFNAAFVSASEGDPNPDDNGADAGVLALGSPAPPTPAAVTITKTPSTTTPNVGDAVTFTITVSNGSTTTVTNVVMTDALPTSLTFVSATPSQGTCSGMPSLSCALGTIAAGQSASVTLVARVGALGAITNVASAAGTGFATVQASAVIGAAAPEPPAPQDVNDDKDEERRRDRREHDERERQEQEEEETQGNVVAVYCNDEYRHPYPEEQVAEDDGQDPPYVVIVTVDGNQKIRLRGRYARQACTTIRVGDYLEANGEKQHEHLFDADGVKIRVPMP